jgi:hypothetical protein
VDEMVAKKMFEESVRGGHSEFLQFTDIVCLNAEVIFLSNNLMKSQTEGVSSKTQTGLSKTSNCLAVGTEIWKNVLKNPTIFRCSK